MQGLKVFKGIPMESTLQLGSPHDCLAEQTLTAELAVAAQCLNISILRSSLCICDQLTMLRLIINIHEHELEFHILAHLTRAFNNNNEQLIINKLTSDN